jgi:hypothetical protein
VDLDEKRGHQRVRRYARDICDHHIKNGRRVVRRLGRQKLVAARDNVLTAFVGIRRRAIALLAAICGLLIELSAGKAVEGPNKQKDCQEGDGNMNASTHYPLK